MATIRFDTRKKILDAAARVFAKSGFKKSSIDEIARVAGVGKGTVYLAAPSKEDLFFQVAHREVRELQGYLLGLVDPRARADALLKTLILAAADFVSGRPVLLDLLCGRLGQTLPSLNAQFETLRTIGRATLVEVLRLGIRQGIFRADLDVEQVARMLQDFELAPFVLRKPTRAELQKSAEIGSELVLRGLCAR